MMSLWDALRMNMMISYQELVRTFPKRFTALIAVERLGFFLPVIYAGEKFGLTIFTDVFH